MARYQVHGFPSDSFLRLPYAFIDLHMADFDGNEVKVLLYILRRTVGFHKASDHISLAQFSRGIERKDGTVLDRGTGLPIITVRRTLAALEARGVITKKRTYRTATGAEGPSRIVLNWNRVMTSA